MKLSLINEDIKKTDFYDLYSLIYAYQSDMSNTSVKQHLESLVNHILSDHLYQFGNILLDRLIDEHNNEIKQLMDQYDIHEHNYVLTHNLSLDDMCDLIPKLIAINHRFNFTGDTWFSLASKFIELYRSLSKGLTTKIYTIDKLYNLFHHSGHIIDYMDEYNWLENALNTRDNASPSQLFNLSSSGVRSLIGRSSYHGQYDKPVSEIDKLYTSLRRQIHDGINVKKVNDTLILSVIFNTVLYKGDITPLIVWDGKTNKLQKHMILGDKISGTIFIKESNDTIIITNNNQTIDIAKPISKQFKLVTDLISATISVAKTGLFGNFIRNHY
jgi:hypothetical protein